ncbi:MAG: hypothetical protein IJ418_04810 [Clostridia bacterium]|nr:hypothetical protein [Clostridia bacterium]
MNILEDLWCGNIRPSEYDVSSCREYTEALERINHTESELQNTLSDEKKVLFAQYTESIRSFMHMLIACCSRTVSG